MKHPRPRALPCGQNTRPPPASKLPQELAQGLGVCPKPGGFRDAVAQATFELTCFFWVNAARNVYIYIYAQSGVESKHCYHLFFVMTATPQTGWSWATYFSSPEYAGSGKDRLAVWPLSIGASLLFGSFVFSCWLVSSSRRCEHPVGRRANAIQTFSALD